MVSITLGILSGAMVVVIFAFGYALGRYTPKQGKTEELSSEEARQRKELEDSQKAFRTLMTYNINDVYGTGVPRGGDDE